MKIALITGSRSDCNALEMVEKALNTQHQVKWITAVSGRSATDPLDAASIVTDSIEFVSQCLNGNYSDLITIDLAILHGDRHEILGAAVAASIMGIPIAHLGGGDITEGSQDDGFRHAITKLSHLHFPTNQDAADRIIQMGEEPDRVHMVGDAGIDRIMATPVLERDATFAAAGLAVQHYGLLRDIRQRTILVLFHPNTLGDTAAELEALSFALARRTEALVLIGPNADAGSDLIRREWQRLAAERPDTVYHDNVEPQVFYSLLKWCDVLVGNSSAGFYEAPCFATRVINLGDRQKGRSSLADNVIQITPATRAGDIEHAISVAHMGYPIVADRKPCRNVYGDGHAAERIAKVIGEIKEPKALLRKRFLRAFFTLQRGTEV